MCLTAGVYKGNSRSEGASESPLPLRKSTTPATLTHAFSSILSALLSDAATIHSRLLEKT